MSKTKWVLICIVYTAFAPAALLPVLNSATSRGETVAAVALVCLAVGFVWGLAWAEVCRPQPIRIRKR